jgi:hypothetical protein
MLPRIPNHLLCDLRRNVPQQEIHTRGYTWLFNLGLAGSPQPRCGRLQSLTRLSLLWVPHFRASCGASLKDLNLDTTSANKAKCFLVSRWNMRKHSKIGKPLKLWGARVIYRVEQITHREITKNKTDQVIVTMHASKIKTRQEQNIQKLGLKVYKER